LSRVQEEVGQVSLRVISMRDTLRPGEIEINTTSRTSVPWQQGLSPFFLGPCPLYGGRVAKNMENAWQFAKLYEDHADEYLEPTDDYWDWALGGWYAQRAHRYPMGKGRKPICSLWDGERLTYVEARKQIYVPLYAEAVQKSHAWNVLKVEVGYGNPIALRDFDGYDHLAGDKSLSQVLNDPTCKIGHAFVLMMLLLDDPALQQCEMR
jgi:uncharacterized protein DUF6939